MKPEFVDCFLLIGTALSLNNNQKLPEMGQPLTHNTTTTCVQVSISLEEMRFVDINSMEADITLLLHQRWTDPRLGANIRTRKMAVAGQIWRPKITVTKGLKNCCANTEETQFWRGSGNEGHVLLSEKVTVKTYCTRNFRRFPFDSQICELKFGTYRFPMDEVQLTWDSKPVEVLTDVDLHEFKLSNVSAFHEVDIRSSGNFSVLVVQVLVTRYYLHYILCMMVPCMILVLLTYTSFWIQQKNSGLRLGLSLAVVLFLVYFYYISTCLTMKERFLKSLDVFVILCLTFASFSFFENCAMSYILSDVDMNSCKNTVDMEKNLQKIIIWMECAIRIIFPIFYICCIMMLLYCSL